jgi:hypothetical protein
LGKGKTILIIPEPKSWRNVDVLQNQTYYLAGDYNARVAAAGPRLLFWWQAQYIELPYKIVDIT